MASQAISQIESRVIGTAPRAVSAPERQRIAYREFGIPSGHPLPGGTPIDEFVAALESDAEMAPRLAKARKSIADRVDQPGTLRNLRLSLGLSQDRLAALAGTTQSYIARVEAGTLDPGTDMLGRLAIALKTSEFSVFAAVRNQRTQQVTASGR